MALNSFLITHQHVLSSMNNAYISPNETLDNHYLCVLHVFLLSIDKKPDKSYELI